MLAKQLNELDEEAEMQNNLAKSIGQIAQGAREQRKLVLVRPPTKLDDEAGIQAKSGQKVQSWMAKK